jgi:hypothetical protein
MKKEHSMSVVKFNCNIDLNVFFRNANTVYHGLQERVIKNPYGVAIVYVKHIAAKETGQQIFDNAQGGSKSLVNVLIENDNGNRFFLWHNLDSEDSWFVNCWYEDGVNPRIYIPIEKCTPIQSDRRDIGVGGCDNVNIDVSELPNTIGRITLTFNWVRGMILGFAHPNQLAVAVATHAMWVPNQPDRQNEIIIHEVGHKIEMVPNPNSKRHRRKLLDIGTYHYDDSKGHQGDHCHYDIRPGQIRYDSSQDVADAKCVMFGAKSPRNIRKVFCPNCRMSVKKMDLSKGV